MAKPRKKSPRRPRQTKVSSSQALNGDLFRIVAETTTDIMRRLEPRHHAPAKAFGRAGLLGKVRQVLDS